MRDIATVTVQCHDDDDDDDYSDVLPAPHLMFCQSHESHMCLCMLQVLQNLGKDKFSPQSFEQVGTRIAKVLEKVSLLGFNFLLLTQP